MNAQPPRTAGADVFLLRTRLDDGIQMSRHPRAPSTIHLVSSDDSDTWQSIGALARRVVALIEKPRG